MAQTMTPQGGAGSALRGPRALDTRPVRLVLVLAVAGILTWFLGYWIRQSEILTLACQITEAVPSIPAVATLLVVLLLNPLLRLVPRFRGLSSGEIALLYIFTAVATMMFGCAVVRFLISSLSSGYYYSTPDYPIEQLMGFLPSWLSPKGPLVHKMVFEGAPSGLVPWSVWLAPMLSWTGLFLLFGGTLLGLMLLVADRWIDQERLAFPLVQLPLEMMGQGHSGSFFKNKAMWIGVAIAAAINFYMATKAVFYGGPPGTLQFILGNQTTEYPWAAVFPVSLNIRPEVIGLGYLVSTEVSFSVWFSWLLHKLQAVILSGVGYRVEGMPFTREQGSGAYFVMGLLLLWRDRRVVREAWRGWFGGQRRPDQPHQWALVAAVLGALGILAFWTAAGMAAWLAVVYLALLLMVALVYARARAEAGVPLLWLYPIAGAQPMILSFLGSTPIINAAQGLASPTIFVLNNLFNRGYFPTVAAYHIEGLRLGRSTGVHWRQLATTVMLAIAWGTIAAFIFHLTPYYERGGITLQGNIWGDRDAKEAYKSVLRLAGAPQGPDTKLIVATLSGGAFAGLLAFVRTRWLSFPLNPIGYAVACSYGSLVWGPFFLVWLLKSVILHYGGQRAYLATMPAFLGFALGHFLTAGVIWGTLSAALGGIFRRWAIWFG